MKRTIVIGLLTLASFAVGTAAHAQIISIQTPRVSVRVGPPIIPGVAVAVPGQYVPARVIVQSPFAPPQFVPAPIMPPADGAFVPAPVLLRPMTHREFAACFRPVPGCHEALLIHPGSGCPVLVRFSLPPGCPIVRVGLREVEFDYGCREVEIRFKLFGKVAVNY